jgi:hypothetical protein
MFSSEALVLAAKKVDAVIGIGVAVRLVWQRQLGFNKSSYYDLHLRGFEMTPVYGITHTTKARQAG